MAKRPRPTAVVRKPRLPTINWKPETTTPHGSGLLESMDGTFRLYIQDQFEGIPMARECTLWQFKRGRYVRAFEHRSRTKCEREARVRQQQLDNQDDDQE